MQAQYEYEKVAQAILLLEREWKLQPSLEEIAEKVNVSPYHFQRMFTKWAGVSPKKFVQYLTVSYTKQRLNAGKPVSLIETAEEAGLSSSSRLHDLFVSIEGMTPGEYKRGGVCLTIRFDVQNSQFGKYLIASTDKGVCQLHFFDNGLQQALQDLKSMWPNAKIVEGTDLHQEQVAKFFRNDFETERVKLHLRGTDFQLKVWEALLKIPQGNLTTYGTIAHHIQCPSASRAVGTAIGNNPIAFIIPCHRVIQQAGKIGEFRWGTVRKKAMIGWEASQLKIES